MKSKSRLNLRAAAGFLAFLGMISAPPAAQGETVSNADLFDLKTGFRIAQYRAPVPQTPDGAVRVTAEDVRAYRDQGALLIDVRPLRVFEITEEGEWLYAKPQTSLPGAIWLPVVGQGKLEDWQATYLERSLRELTEGDVKTPIVVFCRVDCWMSWNAAKRFAALGYERLYWYAEGVDGWEDSGGGFAPVIPFPVRDLPPRRKTAAALSQ